MLSRIDHDIDISEEDKNAMKISLQGNQHIITLLKKTAEIRQAMEYHDSCADDWVYGSNMFGITTYYRTSTTGGDCITIKMEGVIDDLPTIEQCAVVREIDLFQEWFPLCSKSVMVDSIGHADYFAYICIGLPFFSRDVLMSVYAVDMMQEQGKVLVLGRSVPEEAEEAKNRAIPVPFGAIGWFHNRIVVKDLKATFELTSPTSVKAVIITEVDFNAPLPQSVIKYLIQNLAGIVLSLLQQQAIKVKNNPTCKHAVKINTDAAFYRDWVLPKLRLLYSSKGWDFQLLNTGMIAPNDLSAAVTA